MTIAQARQEFGKRYDLWALYAAERAVEESFPQFRMFKGGITWKFYQFVQKLSKHQQLSFVRIRRKSAYFNETNKRSEPLSEKDNEFLNRYRASYWGQHGLEIEIPRRRRAGEKIKFASKKTLQKAITEKFVSITVWDSR